MGETIGKNWVEKVAARTWFGRHATGSVILVNGWCAFHGTPTEATSFLKRLRMRAAENEEARQIVAAKEKA